MSHAKLSASGSKKWLACAPSANLEATLPDEASDFAAEGTFAHEIFETLNLHMLGLISEEERQSKLDQFRQSPVWSEELFDAVVAAHALVCERVKEAEARCKDPIFLVERRLDFSPWVPEGFGTGDFVIVTDDLIEVMDYKHGKGVYVDAADNSQLRLYGLGAYNELSCLYEFKRVRMTVLQPRLNNYSSEELSVEELLQWGEEYVKPRAQAAWTGEGPFVAGEHCSSGFCRARFTCSARAKQALALAKEDFALQPPELMTDDQIAQVLAKGDIVAKWISDVQGYALQEAERGKQWPGYKLVEGRSVRKYANQDAVAERLKEAGIPEEVIYERSLLGITAMEKTLGKTKFASLLDGLVVKPQGKPVLVPDSDKRTALSAIDSAIADFT